MSETNGLVHHEECDSRVMTGERRAHVRCPCDIASSCQPVTMPTATQPEMVWSAKVRDISEAGVGMVLKRRFEPGTPLIVELTTTVEGTLQTVVAQVVRVFRADGDSWYHGCKFEVRLAPGNLKTLL